MWYVNSLLAPKVVVIKALVLYGTSAVDVLIYTNYTLLL